MYLKALEIQGFKSFPDKTRLEFDRDITSIVGPNGSGKSNISDALRWVMGEQSSRSLRGGRMEDVIFGGTEKRSASGFAQVSLTIDNTAHILNSDSPEVTVTRRYYVSGESEYYINRESVRLRDINEMLMDTGLGRDGYSIIGQGRIDEILSAKSTDRREVFEEAAGISRYRYRKEEAERKLERTGENLVRVNDKISELELQVEPLRKQSETAKKYLILRDELRGLEIAVWCSQLEKLRVKNLSLAQEYEVSKKKLESYTGRLEEIYGDSERITEEMHSLDIEADAVRNDITAREGRIAELEGAAAVLEANISALEKTIESINEEITAQENRAGSLAAQIEEHKTRLASIDERRSGLAEEYAAITGEAESVSESNSEAEKKLAGILQSQAEENDLAAQCRALAAAAAASVEELERTLADADREKRELEARLEAAEKDAAEKERMLVEAEETVSSAENVQKGFALRLENRRKKADELGKEKTELTINLEGTRSRVTMLRDMEKEFQGYSNAVRAVMQAKERGELTGVHGPVANLLRTGDRYTLAIETALGAAAQNVIVTDDESGKAGIEYLKRKDAGVATFAPISTLRPAELREKGLEAENGFEGVAADLVTFDPKYKNIYTHFLGRVVVAENLNSAIKIGRKYSNRFRIVTLDGQTVNAGGTMTGGSTSQKTGILSRANQLEKLEAELRKLEKRETELDSAVQEAARELAAAQERAELSAAELRTAQDSVLACKAESLHAQQAVEAIRESIEAGAAEMRERQNRITESRERKEKLSAEEKEHIDAAASYRAQADEMILGREELQKQGVRLSEKIADLRAEKASLDAAYSAAEASVRDLTAMWEELRLDKEQRGEKTAEVEKHIAQARDELEEKRKLSAEASAEADLCRTKLTETVNRRLEMEAERTKRDKESQEKNRELLDLQKENSRLEQQLMSAEFEEKQIVDKLWDNYELTPTAAEQQRTELESTQKAAKRISELKKSISALGPPNIAAIDEFERVNERYTYLTGQRDDIENSKREIEAIIRDITSEMKEIFLREFEVINNSFRETFLELFGGGRAELTLEDEEDILNCGIEIKVQPPGKSLKTLMLLSGGERAFVAIAIYFAILKVRPTPFCVMDEIDSALDEANVHRFADYLRSISDKTQLLLITHRRGTMEGADALFGVTMQQGISKVISIDLAEAEKNISA